MDYFKEKIILVLAQFEDGLMDYSKENIISVLAQLQDRLFQRKYYISNHDVLYLSLRPLDR